jgi:hypothetical protein
MANNNSDFGRMVSPSRSACEAASLFANETLSVSSAGSKYSFQAFGRARKVAAA